VIFDLYDERDTGFIKNTFAGVVGLTSGSFDLFHVAHGDYLDCCRRHCGHDGALIVGVDSDYLIRQRKGPTRPIIPESDRLRAVAGRKGVAAAFLLGTVDDFGKAAELLKVKYIFKNQDYTEVKVLGADLPGVEVVIVPDFHRTESTSELIKQVIKTQQIEKAEEIVKKKKVKKTKRIRKAKKIVKKKK
jgi:cytidyltransferase-like protein